MPNTASRRACASREVPMTDPIRALLVDDEPLARTDLRLALTAASDWHVVAECGSADEARGLLAMGSVDVVLLDIRMPRESGVALARQLVAQASPPLVVFVTAYDAHAVEAFDLHAVDYLLKPVDDARLRQTIDRVEAVRALHAQRDHAAAVGDSLDEHPADPRATRPYLTRFSVRSVGRIDSVAVSDVQWITSAGNYARLGLPGRTLLHRVTLAHLEARLDPAQFLRVHRTAIVRRDRLKALRVTGDGTYQLTLHGGMEVPVSERHVAAVRAAMGE